MSELQKKQQLEKDYDAGPVSLDLIDTNLYLGNLSAAVDLETLHSCNITHILTLDICPLPRKITDMPNLKVKFIQLTDQPKEDILCLLQDADQFITDAVDRGCVLVHCYFGVSRSAAFVIAYIMKKYKLNYEDGFTRVKEKRNLVYPNTGFQNQLRLYAEMGHTIDKINSKYRQFRLSIAADSVRKSKVLAPHYMDLIKHDPGLNQVNPEPKVLRCKKCRRIVACESNIISHSNKNKLYWNERSSINLNKTDNDDQEKKLCEQTYFIEPIAWMNNITQNVQGKIHCPKCSSKLGSFSWIMGCQCPCGTKVSPAFYLCPSKVEWSNAVKNVQITV